MNEHASMHTMTDQAPTCSIYMYISDLRSHVVHPLPPIQAFCLLLCACTTLALILAGAPSRMLCCLVLLEGCVSTSCQALSLLPSQISDRACPSQQGWTRRTSELVLSQANLGQLLCQHKSISDVSMLPQ